MKLPEIVALESLHIFNPLDFFGSEVSFVSPRALWQHMATLSTRWKITYICPHVVRAALCCMS